MSSLWDRFEIGTYRIDGIYSLVVGRHGRFMCLHKDGIGHALTMYGEWAEAETALLCSLIEPGDLVIDVGAHIGTQAIPLATKVGASGQVVAFEPQQELFKLLAANAVMNGLMNLHPIHAAVGAENNNIRLPQMDYRESGNFGGISLTDASTTDQLTLGHAPCIILDEFMAETAVCKLIKIDVEGMEGAVLAGGTLLINRTRPFIYCEANTVESFNEIRNFCHENRYDMYWHSFPGYSADNYFSNEINMWGDKGDVNVLLCPREKPAPFAGPRATHFKEVSVLFPGVLGEQAIAPFPSSRSRAVLALCAYYTFDQIRPFIESFRRNVRSAKLVLFVAKVDDRILTLSSDPRIELIDASPLFNLPHHIQNSRFSLYDKYVDENLGSLTEIMVSDIRDVIFQADPFEVPRSTSIYFAEEDKVINQCEVNSRWVRDRYSQALLDEIGHHPISCSGTTLGNAQEMSAYIKLMWAEISERSVNQLDPHDQGMHNYIAWKVKPPYVFVDPEDKIFQTVGYTPRNRISFQDGLVHVDGFVAPVVHQWDRHPDIEADIRANLGIG